MSISEKDPLFVAAGRRAVRVRWDRDAEARGLTPGPRILRLDTLSPAQRELIAAILDATTSETGPETAVSGPVMAGGTTDAAPST